jgi:hypothetical protein
MNVLKRTPRAISQGALRPVSNGFCHNCGNAISGHFCANCGQKTNMHPASTREFLHEFVGHHVALEGRLWRTLYLLMLRPGRLTNEYIGGRRARYLEPLRLFMSVSVLFFLLIKFGGVDLHLQDTQAGAPSIDFSASDSKNSILKLSKNAKLPADIRRDLQAEADKITVPQGETGHIIQFDQKDRDALAARNHEAGAVAAIDRYFRVSEKAQNFAELPNEEQIKLVTHAFFSLAPYAIFCLMPVFALLLKLLYMGSGRRYGEHMLFALHVNAFAYVQIGLLFALAIFRPPLGVWASFALGIWLLVYLPLAMQHTYGGRRRYTLLRWVFLMTVYMMAMVLALMSAIAMGILN